MTIENECVVQNRVIASNINAPTSNVKTPTSKGTRTKRMCFEVTGND